jgi:polysaccharide export outer membrane protein
MKNRLAGQKGLMSDRMAVEGGANVLVRERFDGAVLRRGLGAQAGGWLVRAATVSFILCVGGYARQSQPRTGPYAGFSAAQTTQNAEAQHLRDGQPKSGNSAANGEASSSSPNTPFPAEIKKDHVDPNAYFIGEQDALVITVWKEKEISGGVVVRPDGKITVPLVGEIRVVGMTPIQLQSLLVEKLKPFVTVPQVTVAVTEIRSRKIYLIGHAAREGPFPINSTTTVLQIIAQAGGLKDFAKRKKIYILRQHGTEQTRFDFNYEQVIKGQHIEQNILLEPGDTIVVP